MSDFFLNFISEKEDLYLYPRIGALFHEKDVAPTSPLPFHM